MFCTKIVTAFENGELDGVDAIELSGGVCLLCLYEMAADERAVDEEEGLPSRTGSPQAWH